MGRLFAGLILILAACLPLASAYAWFMQPGMAQQCSFNTFSAGTGGASGAWVNIAMSSNGTYMTTGNNSTAQLRVSSDGGATWAAKGTSTSYQRISMSSDGSKQIAAGNTLYTSTDYGATWTSRNSARSWIGTGISDDGTKMLGTVYGGQLYVSTDSGANFTARDSNRNWSDAFMSADGTKAVALVGGGGNIYISTNIASGGTTWTATSAPVHRWWAIRGSSDFTKLYAVTDGGGVYRSTDSGTTWDTVDDLGNASWRGVDVSSDGSTIVVASGGTGSVGRVYRSTDEGNTWKMLSNLAAANYLGVGLSGDGLSMGVTYASGTPVTEQCNYSDKFDGSASDPTSQTFSCGGTVYGGYCWYKGASGASCDTACSGHGSCSISGTLAFSGSSGTAANCQGVAGAVDGTTYGSYTSSAITAGCNYKSGLVYGTTTTTCAATSTGANRYCSCTQ